MLDKFRKVVYYRARECRVREQTEWRERAIGFLLSD